MLTIKSFFNHKKGKVTAQISMDSPAALVPLEGAVMAAALFREVLPKMSADGKTAFVDAVKELIKEAETGAES